ncbi:MAG: LamG domain-containing protein [Candidatus Brennerbacteria bacterium]|nr:LamG domain-containing protein [Candidatus Brennerbacteria bacterium]
MIEVLIGLAIGAIMIGAASLGVVFILRSSTATQYIQSGTQLSQDLVDRARTVAGATWQDLYNLTKGTSTAYFVAASGTKLITIEGKEGVPSNEIFDGLIGHWKFDESTSTATTTAFDVSGGGYHGTLTGGTKRATSTCKVSHCLDFDGSDDYVDLGDPSDGGLDAFTAMTVAGWFKFDTLKTAGLVGKGDADPAQPGVAYILWTRGGGDDAVFYINDDLNNGNINRSAADVLTAGRWYHIAGTWDGGTTTSSIKVYIDGVQSDNSTVTEAQGFAAMRNSSLGTTVGRGLVGTVNQYVDGNIDDVRIYNRALSADEVQRLYNSTAFTRYFQVENVNRDSGGSIVSSGGNEDPSTQKVTAYVEWPGASGAVGQVKVVDYVTRWANRIFNQSDWSGGSGQTGVITSPNNRYDNATSVSNPLGSIRIEGL